MQLANITLALGGDRGQTIQKFGVTPAEVAVLREIHGEASVFDVQPLDEDAERSNREERTRLLEIYGKPPGSRELSAVEVLFPGAAARVFENFDELELDESFYKATDRARPKKAQKPKEREDEPEPDEDEPEPEPTSRSRTRSRQCRKRRRRSRSQDRGLQRPGRPLRKRAASRCSSEVPWRVMSLCCAFSTSCAPKRACR